MAVKEMDWITRNVTSAKRKKALTASIETPYKKLPKNFGKWGFVSAAMQQEKPARPSTCDLLLSTFDPLTCKFESLGKTIESPNL